MTEPAFREDRRAVMARFDGSWERLRGRLRELAERERAGERVGDTVSLGQAIAHVAHWDEAAATVLQAGLAGSEMGEDFDGRDAELNARWLAEDLHVTLDDAERRLGEAHASLRGALESLDERLWDEIGEAWALGGIEHYEAHLAEPFDFPISRDEAMRLFEEHSDLLRTRLMAVAAEEQQAPGREDVTLGQGISHIAHWDESSVEVIAARREDPSAPDPYSGRDKEWNARWLEEDANADANDALDRLEQASRALAEQLRSLDEDEWRRYGLRYAIGSAVHYRSHTDHPLEFPLPSQSPS